jgi:hypothetical protein
MIDAKRMDDPIASGPPHVASSRIAKMFVLKILPLRSLESVF